MVGRVVVLGLSIGRIFGLEVIFIFCRCIVRVGCGGWGRNMG